MFFWFLNGFCFAFLCLSVNAVNGRALQMDFLESLNAAKDHLLENWAEEIQHSHNVLVFPVAVAQEYLLEHAFRLPDGSAEKTQLEKFIRNDTESPVVLDLSQFTATAFQELAIQTFYRDNLPEMNATIEDPLYFSYRAFMEWSEVHQDAASGTSRRAMLTVAAMRIRSIQSVNFTWIEKIEFLVSEDHRIETQSLMNVGIYDYAEFNYPMLDSCTAGVLRLQINDDLSMIFVLPLNVSDAQCSASENLLRVFQNNTLEAISFRSQRMYVSIPIIQVATIVNPANKLTQMGLLTPEPYVSQTPSISAGNYEAAALIFNPEVPKDAPIPMISRNTPRFHAERPFLVAVLQKENPAPVLYGLIQNPNAEFECCTPPESSQK